MFRNIRNAILSMKSRTWMTLCESNAGNAKSKTPITRGSRHTNELRAAAPYRIRSLNRAHVLAVRTRARVMSACSQWPHRTAVLGIHIEYMYSCVWTLYMYVCILRAREPRGTRGNSIPSIITHRKNREITIPFGRRVLHSSQSCWQ